MRREGRLGGDGRLPALGAAAPDDLRAPGAGDDGAVLGGPPARPDERRPQLPLPQAATATSSTATPSAASTGCSRRRSPTRRCSSTSTRPSRPRSTRTRTSRASCSRSTPSAPASSPRTTWQAMARVLTGWRVDVYESWDAYYDPESHARGKVKVLGFKDKNKSKDGRELDPRGAPLPGPPPRHGAPDRAPARREVRPRRPAGRARRAAGEGLPARTTRRSCRCCARWSRSSAFQGSGRPQGARPQRGRRRDVPGARAARRPAARATAAPPT